MMGIRRVDNLLAAQRRKAKGGGRRRRMKGRGIMDVIRKVGGFLKQHKVISRVGGVLGKVLPGKFGNSARVVGTAAGSLGYGRRRRVHRCGRGLRLSGH